jgi:L(+)-tartrate dehydratase beta subunit
MPGPGRRRPREVEPTTTLRAPIAPEDVAPLRIGDEVYLDGSIFVLRDATHHRIFDEHVPVPTSLKGQVVLHGAPSVQTVDGKLTIVSLGPTTSMRVERYTPALVEELGVPVVIGKGGMGPGTTAAMQRAKAVYLALVGGTSALLTSQIEAVEERWWPDLLGESLWKLRVKQFGPAIVAIDSTGQNLFADIQGEARKRVAGIAASR